MRRGPKNKPTAILRLTGSRQPINTQEPRGEPGLPRCPSRFNGEHRRLWRLVGRQLVDAGVMTKLDGPGLEVLISLMVDYQTAAAQVAKTGMVWIAPNPTSKIPQAVKNPYWVAMIRTTPMLLACLREFGLTPSSRASLKVPGPKVTAVDDPASRYFGGPGA